MGLGDFVSGLFGGTNDSSQDKQYQLNRENMDYIKQQAGMARNDALNFIPAGLARQDQGYRDAMNLLSGTIPHQMQLTGRGALGAGNTLTAGLGGMNAAIMGQPYDPSQLGNTFNQYMHTMTSPIPQPRLSREENVSNALAGRSQQDLANDPTFVAALQGAFQPTGREASVAQALGGRTQQDLAADPTFVAALEQAMVQPPPQQLTQDQWRTILQQNRGIA